MRRFPFAPARRAGVARALLLVALVIGYADLVRGGLVIAPIALVAGYLLLAPIVLLTD